MKDLTPESLEQMLINVKTAVDDKGERIDVRPTHYYYKADSMNIKELAEQAGLKIAVVLRVCGEDLTEWQQEHWAQLEKFAELVAAAAIKNAKAAKKAAKFQKLVKKMRAFQAEHYFTCYQPLYLHDMIEAFPDYKKKHVKRAYKETE